VKRFALALVVVLIVAYLLGAGREERAAAAPASNSSAAGVVVDGTGETSGTPDVLRLTLGINVTGADVSSALNRASAAIKRIESQLRQRGAKPADIQTSDVSIYPETTKQGRRYHVRESLTAKLRNLKVAGEAISAAVTAGGTGVSLDGVSFSLEDNKKLLDNARDKAFADARQKALRYAGLAGRSLGEVLLVSESVVSPPVAYDGYDGYDMKRQAASAPALSPVPLYGGSSQLSVSVTVRWALA